MLLDVTLCVFHGVFGLLLASLRLSRYVEGAVYVHFVCKRLRGHESVAMRLLIDDRCLVCGIARPGKTVLVLVLPVEIFSLRTLNLSVLHRLRSHVKVLVEGVFLLQAYASRLFRIVAVI